MYKRYKRVGKVGTLIYIILLLLFVIKMYGKCGKDLEINKKELDKHGGGSRKHYFWNHRDIWKGNRITIIINFILTEK